MADGAGFRYAVTVSFTDGHEPVTERCMREETVDRIKNAWHRAREHDRTVGIIYEIAGFEVTEL